MLFYRGRQQIVDANGEPVANAKAYFYLSGTTSPASVYADSALTTPHANPVRSLADGHLPPIYLDPNVTYKCVITDEDDVALPDGSVDPITSSIFTENYYRRTSTEIANSVTPTDYSYPPGNVLRYGAVADGLTDNRQAFIRAVLATPTGGRLVIPGSTLPYLVDTSGGESTAIEIDRQMTVEINGIVKASDGAVQTNPPTIFLVSADDVTFNGTGRLVGDGETNSVNSGTDAIFPSLVKVTGDNFTMTGLTVDTPHKVGVFFYGALRGKVTGCNFVGGPASYTDTAHFAIRAYQGGKHIITDNQFFPSPVDGGMCVQCVFSNSSDHLLIDSNIAIAPYEKLAYLVSDRNTVRNNIIIGNLGYIPGTNTKGTIGPPIRHDGVGGSVTNNQIYFCGGGVSAIGGGALLIEGNSMEAVGQSGVAIFGGSVPFDRLVIRNNQMKCGDIEGIVVSHGVLVDAPNGTNLHLDISHNQVIGFAPTDTIANVAAWTSAAEIPAISMIKPTSFNGRVYMCASGGTTGGSEPAWPTTPGDTVVDGDITWTCVAIDNTSSAGIKCSARATKLTERSQIAHNIIDGGTQDCRTGIWTEYVSDSTIEHNYVRANVIGIREDNGGINRYVGNAIQTGGVQIQNMDATSHAEGNTFGGRPNTASVTLPSSVATTTISNSVLLVAPHAKVMFSPSNEPASDYIVAHGLYASVSSDDVVITSGDSTNFAGTETLVVHVIQ